MWDEEGEIMAGSNNAPAIIKMIWRTRASMASMVSPMIAISQDGEDWQNWGFDGVDCGEGTPGAV
jgi:hypothetical protein